MEKQELLNAGKTKKVFIIPIEVIVRNIAAGSFSKRYGVEEACVRVTERLNNGL